MMPRFFAVVALLAVAVAVSADPPAAKSSRDALKVFGDQIGDWKCTGTPVGRPDDVQKGFWTERMTWGWKFKNKDAWIAIDFEKGKNFISGELRYVPEKDHFTLTMT